VFSNISKILSHSEEYQDVCEDTRPDIAEVSYLLGIPVDLDVPSPRIRSVTPYA